MKRFSLLALIAFATLSCSKKNQQTLTIYTSTYKEVIEIYKPELKKAFPDLDIEWYQAGSENVAAKVMAEMQGGGVNADMIMTSDLFFYQELKKSGQLLPITAANLAKLPANYVDSDK